MDLTIRRAREGDAPSIAKVHVETWQSAYKGQVPEAVLSSLSIGDRTERWAKTIAAADPKKALFVAVEDEEVVGFSIVCPARDGGLPHLGELSAIYVSPSFQGQGTGLQLMDAGLDFLKQEGYSKAMLWVLKSNAAAIDFYNRHGWVVDGAEKEEVKDGFALREIRLTKEL